MSLSIVEELRRRIERIERRPPVPAAPRLPPGPVYNNVGERRAKLRLGELPGSAVEEGVVVVRHRLGPEQRIGRVAPSEAMVASPAAAAPLAGLDRAPVDLLHGLRILDVETTGLSGGTGTLAFVIGLARFEPDGTLVTEQFLLGAPAEEPALLGRIERELDGATLLVTFNGRSFDVPLLRTRCVLARRSSAALERLPHLDLLALARRLWRRRADDCRLVTLEERVLGRRRADDFPGHLAPAAYREFLDRGDARALAPIVEHNREDLAGTAALLGAALRTVEDPLLWAEDACELLAVGDLRLRQGDAGAALPLIERTVALARTPDTLRRALTRLALLHRRAGRIDEARRAWERTLAAFPNENLGYVELAKLLEHRARDCAAALAVAERAPHTAAGDMQRRLARLRRKAGG